MSPVTHAPSPPLKLLAANRSEIAIRIFRAATQLGMRTVAIYAQEDRFGIHRFKADETYIVGAGKGPVGAYLDIEGIIALAREKGSTLSIPATGSSPRTPTSPRPAPMRASRLSAPGPSCSGSWATRRPPGPWRRR